MPRQGATERLSAADAYNVRIEAPDQVNVFQWVVLLGRGGFVGRDGSPDMDLLRAAIAARLREDREGTRRLSQRLVRTRGHWAWADADVDLDWHVREVARVTGIDGLAALCASLAVTPLARSLPPWELLVAPGAARDTLGLIVRLHHSVADGVASVRLAQSLFHEEGQPLAGPAIVPAPPVQPWWRGLSRGAARASGIVRHLLPRTPLLGPIGPHRSVAFADAELAALDRGATAAGGTVNDALLAAVAGAVAVTLRALGEPVPGSLPASVPVALRPRRDTGNAVGLWVVPLPTGEPDPFTRLTLVSNWTREAKGAASTQGTFEIARTRWGAGLIRAVARRQRLVALFVTNVRGPRSPLRIAGAPLERAWVLTPLQGNVRLAVAAFSYAGRLGCTVHVDADALPANVLGDALAIELGRIAELR